MAFHIGSSWIFNFSLPLSYGRILRGRPKSEQALIRLLHSMFSRPRLLASVIKKSTGETSGESVSFLCFLDRHVHRHCLHAFGFQHVFRSFLGSSSSNLYRRSEDTESVRKFKHKIL